LRHGINANLVRKWIPAYRDRQAPALPAFVPMKLESRTQPGTLGYLMQRELVAEVHPPDFSQHFHADHPVFSCSKSEQKQLNTWVSFQSAEQPLLGQFSVSGNMQENIYKFYTLAANRIDC
jgi:hypothetical protein